MPVGYAPPVAAQQGAMTPEQFAQMSRQEQLTWLRANGAGAPLNTSNPKLSAILAQQLPPELQQYYRSVKSDGGTFFGNLLHDAAPVALGAGLLAAGGSALGAFGGGGAAAGA